MLDRAKVLDAVKASTFNRPLSEMPDLNEDDQEVLKIFLTQCNTKTGYQIAENHIGHTKDILMEMSKTHRRWKKISKEWTGAVSDVKRGELIQKHPNILNYVGSEEARKTSLVNVFKLSVIGGLRRRELVDLGISAKTVDRMAKARGKLVKHESLEVIKKTTSVSMQELENMQAILKEKEATVDKIKRETVGVKLCGQL
jgi:hypothetical protein